MNLAAIANGVIVAVNPNEFVTLKLSTGSASNPDFSQTPTYTTMPNIVAQIQELTTKDLAHLDALNVQGSQKAMYFNLPVNPVVRLTAQGGDMVQTADGVWWLTTRVLEGWDAGSWCRVAVKMQTIAPP